MSDVLVIPSFTLVTGFGSCVQKFGDGTAGTAVAGGTGITAGSAPQFHLDAGSVALGNPRWIAQGDMATAGQANNRPAVRGG